MNGVIDFISTICPITGNDLVDTILFALITFVAFCAAWKTAGFLSNDSEIMSFIHWIIRIIVFIALLATILGIINLIHWIGSWPWWVYVIIGISIAHVLSLIVVVYAIRKKKKKKNLANHEE